MGGREGHGEGRRAGGEGWREWQANYRDRQSLYNLHRFNDKFNHPTYVGPIFYPIYLNRVVLRLVQSAAPLDDEDGYLLIEHFCNWEST